MINIDAEGIKLIYFILVIVWFAIAYLEILVTYVNYGWGNDLQLIIGSVIFGSCIFIIVWFKILNNREK